MSDKEQPILNNLYKYIINNKKKDKDVKVAEALFEKMGTPKDSKCPHGLAFFQCMPCSH